MIDWLKHNRSEFILSLAVLLVAVFLRFYRLADYMTFMGDEGRDALVVRDMLVNHHLPLVGPPISFSTEAGNVYLGPLYYYMMAVGMSLAGLSPVGAAAMMAFVGVLAVALIYYLSRAWFGKEAAALTSFVYATSPAVVAYSRSSWNPNPAPFFSMLAILGLFKSLQTKNFRWLILTGIALAFAVQMHYLALLMLPVTFLVWAWGLYLKRARSHPFRYFTSATIISVLSFLALMSPLIIFDIQHGFANFKALRALFFGGERSVNLNPFENLLRIFPMYSRDLVGIYLAAANGWLAALMSVIVLTPFVVALLMKLKGKRPLLALLILAVWLIVGLLGLSLYKRTIYPHYVGFLSPAPFLLLGAFIYYLPQKFKYPAAGVLALLVTIVYLPRNPLMYPPAKQLERTESIARLITERAGDKPYNFALIAAHNYDSAYQFYLEQRERPPKRATDEVTEQLFVVCEDEVCEPTASSQEDIASFGPSTEDETYELYGVRVFKLSHKP